MSKIVPQWMQIKGTAPQDIFKSINYVEHDQKTTMLIDKLQGDHKSIFASGDYRHNVTTKEEADKCAKNTKNEAKVFLQWDDDNMISPIRKRERKRESIEKINDQFIKKSVY